jgi:hypothetical protein
MLAVIVLKSCGTQGSSFSLRASALTLEICFNHIVNIGEETKKKKEKKDKDIHIAVTFSAAATMQ